MSGIVGIVRGDNAPVDPELLARLTEFLSFRGPEGLHTSVRGAAGFGHTLHEICGGACGGRQIPSLDERLWITADARLDARDELLAALASSAAEHAGSLDDAELILRAYACWGEACVEHLRGEFAFAIWDSPERKLFCARDPLGVRPFYYAQAGDAFIFSNTLEDVRLHPGVSPRLDESTIADFLLFGLNCDLGRTIFAEVRRLPPGHSLVWSEGRLRLRRYWTPPIAGRIRYRHEEDYVERFRELLLGAVEDRLRTSQAGVFLSGGIDSSAISTLAREALARKFGTYDLRAYTVVYRSLIPGLDGCASRRVADFLGMPLHTLAADDYRPFEHWEEPEMRWPEPAEDPFFIGLRDQHRMVAEHSRAALSGEGCDNLMEFEFLPLARDLAKRREWAELLENAGRFAWRAFPHIWRRALRWRRRESPVPPACLAWLNPDFARRVRAKERWEEYFRPAAPVPHPVLPNAHASLLLPHWAHLFEQQDAGVTRSPVVVSYPFLDVRLVEFLLSIPPVPWFWGKELLRRSMKGRLPEDIRRRRKTPLPVDPLLAYLRRGKNAAPLWLAWSEKLDPYVSRASWSPPSAQEDPEVLWQKVRLISLDFWLQSQERFRCILPVGAGV